MSLVKTIYGDCVIANEYLNREKVFFTMREVDVYNNHRLFISDFYFIFMRALSIAISWEDNHLAFIIFRHHYQMAISISDIHR
jgi:hypothetical protein